jgi:predicted Rossmann fold nucleotide-binding protein DprA/Smf involved in DNA uptake
MNQTLRDPREVMREEMLMHAPILAAVAEEPLTIPQIAERIGHPAPEVVYWVMGMRRYGFLAESSDADDDGFFAYAATGRQV